MKSSWLSSCRLRWFGPADRGNRRPRLRPRVEALESRTLLNTDTWMNGVSGDWADGTKWSLGAPPAPGDDAVIPSFPAGVIIQHTTGNDTVHNLTSSTNLVLAGGSLTVTGTFSGAIELTPAAPLNLAGTVTDTGQLIAVDGPGVVKLSGTLQGATLNLTNGATLSVQNGGTLDGATLNGNVAVNGFATATVKNGLTLNGTLALGTAGTGGAGDTWGRLAFEGNDTVSGSGDIKFVGGSTNNALTADTLQTVVTLQVKVHGSNGSITSSGAGPDVQFDNEGTILADGDGTITLGGTWVRSAGGTFGYNAGSDLTVNQGTLKDLTVNSTPGAVAALAVNNFDTAAVTGALTLNGTLTLGTAGTGGAGDTWGRVVFEGPVTVTGSGDIKFQGSSTTNALTSDTLQTAVTLRVKVHGSTGSITSSGAGPDVQFDNEGTIVADGHGTITLGGTWVGSAGGTFNSTPGSDLTVNQGTLAGLTLNGTLGVNNFATAAVTGTLTLNGTLTLGSAGTGGAGDTWGRVAFEGSVTVTGPGDIKFVGSSTTNALTADTLQTVVTLGVTVHGQTGSITSSGGGPDVQFDNEGTIVADGDSTITLGGTWVRSTGGTFGATAGSDLTVNQGTLQRLTVNGTLGVNAFGTATVKGGLTLNGTLAVGSGATWGHVIFDGTSQTVSGGGDILFSGTSGSNGVACDTPGGTVTFQGVTVHGTLGSVGDNAPGEATNVTFNNAGTVAADGSGTITFGTVTWTSSGKLEANSPGGTLNLSGTVSSTGTVEVDVGTVHLSGSLGVDGTGSITSQPGTTLAITGNLLGTTQNAVPFTPAGTVLLNGPGNSSAPQQLEVMSQDRGPVGAGFTGNFAYGTLALGGGTYVRLVDQARNSPGSGPEALYVGTLVVPGGCTLDLNHLNVYALATQISGTIVNGSPVIPDLLASGTPVTAIATVPFSGQVASFTVVNPPNAVPGDFTASIDWGDGTPPDTTSGTVAAGPGQFTVSGSHTYAQGGNNTITVTITDTVTRFRGTATAPATVVPLSGTADLEVRESGPSRATAGGAVTYTLTMTNLGPADAQDVTLTDLVPDGTTFVSAAQLTGPTFTLIPPPVGGTGTVVFDPVALAAGQAATFRVVFRAIADGPVTNAVTVTTVTPNRNLHPFVSVPDPVPVQLTLAPSTLADGSPAGTVVGSLTATPPATLLGQFLPPLFSLPAGEGDNAAFALLGAALVTRFGACAGTRASFAVSVHVDVGFGNQVASLPVTVVGSSCGVSAGSPPVLETVEVVRAGKRGVPRALVLTFSAALEPGSAATLEHYKVGLGYAGKGKRRKPLTASLLAAAYDPVRRAVTLQLGKVKGPKLVGTLTLDGVRGLDGGPANGAAVVVDLRPRSAGRH